MILSNEISLNDIWKNINIGFYTFKERDRIPTKPGTYAWYCPLDIRSPKFEDFIKTYKTIFEYDSKEKTKKMERKTEIRFPWKILKQSMQLSLLDLPEKTPLSGKTVKELWNLINADENSLKKFRFALLKSSILLPPLYVGKTKNLSKRYKEHYESEIDSEKNNFKSRFMNHILGNDINIAFEDLIFFAIPMETLPEHSEELLEEIIKLLSQPVYSIK